MNNKNKERICAVVVTYNRKQLLVECLEGILNQTRPVDGIVIIDNNSNDGTPSLLLEKGFINQLPPEKVTEPWEHINVIQNKVKGGEVEILYVRMHENTGGAGGFHEGVKRAYEKGYDWLWLMDDDGLPHEDCLENLLSHKSKGDFINPLVVRKDQPSILCFGLSKDLKTVDDCKKYQSNGIIIGYANPFNGTFLSRNLVSSIGLPRKEFFIWGDEFEYYLRAKSRGFRVITVVDAIFYHPKSKSVAISIFFGKYKAEYIENKFLLYCANRNRAYIARNYKKYRLTFIKETLKSLWLYLLVKFDLSRLFILIKALFDGFLGKFGKEFKYMTK